MKSDIKNKFEIAGKQHNLDIKTNGELALILQNLNNQCEKAIKCFEEKGLILTIEIGASEQNYAVVKEEVK